MQCQELTLQIWEKLDLKSPFDRIIKYWNTKKIKYHFLSDNVFSLRKMATAHATLHLFLCFGQFHPSLKFYNNYTSSKLFWTLGFLAHQSEIDPTNLPLHLNWVAPPSPLSTYNFPTSLMTLSSYLTHSSLSEFSQATTNSGRAHPVSNNISHQYASNSNDILNSLPSGCPFNYHIT